MKPNPGGIITGDAIVDREQDVDLIWRALQGKSVVLTSERRVGKSSVLRKMEENPENGWTPILYWIEGIWHPIEFVEGLYDLIIKKGILTDKFHNLKKYYTKYVGGDQIGSWKLPQIQENWKTLLESTIEDISNANEKVLLMFDELPLMLSHFIQSKDCGPHVGMEFLDTLRGIRNKYESTQKIKFIFCGSIGIHLVIKNLKKNFGYNSDPINNMKIVSLSGMDDSGAKLLCKKLSEDENYQLDDMAGIFDYICKHTDNLPFYIQHVFAYLQDLNEKTITEQSIENAIEYLLNDPKDDGFFNHYIDRIKTYYDEGIKTLALFILDKACKKEDYWQEDDIINLAKTHQEIDDETVKEALNLLWGDHYLVRKRKDGKRFYKFKYSILQNWWITNRG